MAVEILEVAEKEIDLKLEVERQVLAKVGKKKGFYRIVAKEITPKSFRVNIYVEKETGTFMTSIQISDSFYVRVDSDGKICY